MGKRSYKCFVGEETHKHLMDCALKLHRAKLINKPTRYALTQYALINIMNSIKILEDQEKITKELDMALEKSFKKILKK